MDIGDPAGTSEGESPVAIWTIKIEKQDLISDIWEKWGRHIWGKGVLGIQKRKTEFDF